MGRIKETEMFEPLKTWLEAYGYEVYAEVSNGGYRADIVCKHENTFTVIEMKTSMNLEVIEQAFNWRHKAHYVYVAVPMKSDLTIFVRNLLKSAGIGIIQLDIDNIKGNTHCSRICIAAKSKIFRNITYDWGSILLPEFMNNVGGSNDKQNIISKYTVMMNHIKCLLSNTAEGLSLDELAKEVDYYYANPKSSIYSTLTKRESSWCACYKHPENKKTYFKLADGFVMEEKLRLSKILYEAQNASI